MKKIWTHQVEYHRKVGKSFDNMALLEFSPGGNSGKCMVVYGLGSTQHIIRNGMVDGWRVRALVVNGFLFIGFLARHPFEIHGIKKKRELATYNLRHQRLTLKLSVSFEENWIDV